MKSVCESLHRYFNSLTRHRFPFREPFIPTNGLYLLFEKGEKGHGVDRIVRVGTHTGKDQLKKRLKQHFLNENKDRSIFRKNIGRAILNKRNDAFIEFWELNLASRKARQNAGDGVDLILQKGVEEKVSERIRGDFSFVVIPECDKEKRLYLESRIISSVSLCPECKPSRNWLGQWSPKDKIKHSGLWLVNELYKTPFSKKELDTFLKKYRSSNQS